MKTKKKISRTFGKILFVLYVLFVFWFLIFSDWYGRTGKLEEYHYNLVLLREIKRFWNYREQLGLFTVFMNLAGNVLIFVPFGFFRSLATEKTNVLGIAWHSVWLSFMVEVFQYISKMGSFDVDDLLLNTVGGILGYMLFAICRGMRRSYGKK